MINCIVITMVSLRGKILLKERKHDLIQRSITMQTVSDVKLKIE